MFLDRDGVLVESGVVDGVPRPLPSDHLVLLPGVAAACDRLRREGLLLIAVSNQPDISRGTARAEAVAAANAALQEQLRLDAILVCPHDDADGCGCRKPKPGLIVEGARRFGVNLSRSVMVGDRWRDVEAGRRAGCSTVFVDHAYAERRPEAPDLIVRSLEGAIPYILAAAGGSGRPAAGR